VQPSVCQYSINVQYEQVDFRRQGVDMIHINLSVSHDYMTPARNRS
jgi:hypothetical protein